jgi:pyruvate kinase
MTRRAKIVCTLGPATDAGDGIFELARAGMDVARLNFSHGRLEEHAARLAAVRRASDALGRPIAVLADLQGPKIRLGTFAHGGAVWSPGQAVRLTTSPGSAADGAGPAPGSVVSVDWPGLPAAVAPGDRLLVDDGNLTLEVGSTTTTEIACVVLDGGPVSDHKGISVPGRELPIPALTAKDEADLRAALGLGIELVALSFVQRPEDVDPVRVILHSAGSKAQVIAKIEKPQAVERLDEIVAAFDAVMLARGDLGVEMALEQVPIVQRRAIATARRAAKPIIVATQMLESMVTHPRPTRAEATDVATAVFESADALMLSAETSVGAHPIAAVATMARIIEAAESASDGQPPPLELSLHDRATALVQAAEELACNLEACALVAFTETGATARRIARHRPPVPIVAFTPEPAVREQLALSWGVETFVVDAVVTTDEMVAQVERALVESGRARSGDQVVVLAGTPIGQAGSTNTVRVERIR